MSKRGGNSEVNGFISLNSDEKKTSRRRDGTKRGGDDTEKRKGDSDKDLSKSTAQNRSRMSDGKSRLEPSKVVESKGVKTSTGSNRIKNETALSRKTENKLVTKNEKVPSDKLRKSIRNADPKISSTQGINKSLSESLVKSKEQMSSPYVSGARQKTTKSSTSTNKPLKDATYRSTLAQVAQPRTSSYASGEKLKKTSQLNGTNYKSKLSTSNKTASKSSTSKPLATDSGKISKKSTSSSLSKSKETPVSKRKEKYDSVSEESDSQQNIKAFEIPRSNTFTKEGKAPDSLTSDLSITQSQECDSLDQAEGGEYNYDDDFEDYESDFEEYQESEDSISQTEEEIEESSLSSSDTETPDEDEFGDGFKAELSRPQEKTPVPDIPIKKSILKQSSNLNFSSETREKQIEGEKLLTVTVEEERKLDSGSYDLANHVDMRRKKQIQDIRAAMEKENASLIPQSNHHKTRSITEDEGFVEVYNQDLPSYLDTSKKSSKGLINFADARKQQIKQKAKTKVSKRGALLMEMIKLDVMSFNILDIPSVPYEVYMQCYGRSNTYQIHTQTNEDAISEEVQTDDIVVASKWTQHPVKYSSSKSPDKLLFIFSQEKLGVGGENTVSLEEDWLPKLHVNSLRLHNFINNAGEIVLTLLEERQKSRSEVSQTTNKRDFGFSDSFTRLNVKKVDFLKDRPVSIVCFSESNSSNILSVHKPSTEPLTVQEESEGRCVLCTWSIREPSCPLQTLVASNDVSSVCFHSHFVFAGLVDGVVCLWDLREQSTIHCRCFLKLPDWLLRSPTYISAGLERDKRHLSSVVAIKILPESNPDDSAKTTIEQTPTQVVTLDESGLLVVWTVVETRCSVNIDAGLAPWGKVRLVQSSQLRVLKAYPRLEQSMIQCRCLEVDRLKPNNLYIGTNSGQVTHCLQSSVRAKPQFYTPHPDNNSTITCMDFSKCGYSLLMVGDTNGRVQIYRTMTERPLLDIAASAADSSPPVRSVQWSPVQPGLFFVLDANSSIHVWDLCASDMCPQMTVPFTSQVLTSIALTPHPDSRVLAVASEAGDVNVYHLKAEFCALPKKEKEEQLKLFSRYINIL